MQERTFRSQILYLRNPSVMVPRTIASEFVRSRLQANRQREKAYYDRNAKPLRLLK